MSQIILIPLYYFFKSIVWIGLKIYNPLTYVLGKQNLKQKGPLIIVSNHPNTLLDPLHVAVIFPRYVHLLANASLFKNPIVGWLLNQLYCIPIQRTQDTGGKPLNNVEAFKRSTDFLRKNGCLYIAPEGTSWMEKRLHPIKTGTARIALNFGKETNFEKELVIIAVGIVYDKPNYFGSKVRIVVNNPIKISDYKNIYFENEKDAVQNLTKKIELDLKNSIIHTETIENERIFNTIQNVYYANSKESYLENVDQSCKIAKKLLQIQNGKAEEFLEVEQTCFSLEQNLNKYNVDILLKNKRLNIAYIIFLLATFPIFILGFIFNWFVAALPIFIKKLLKPVIEYHSTFNFLGGLIGLILIYPLNIKLLEYYFSFNSTYLEWWGIVIGMLLLGVAAKWWQIFLLQTIEVIKWKKLRKGHPEDYKTICELEQKTLNYFL